MDSLMEFFPTFVILMRMPSSCIGRPLSLVSTYRRLVSLLIPFPFVSFLSCSMSRSRSTPLGHLPISSLSSAGLFRCRFLCNYAARLMLNRGVLCRHLFSPLSPRLVSSQLGFGPVEGTLVYTPSSSPPCSVLSPWTAIVSRHSWTHLNTLASSQRIVRPRARKGREIVGSHRNLGGKVMPIRVQWRNSICGWPRS
ncbi:hypothetical protein H4582DRAFT_1267528 [Lactarius indigo]|nr:hypothetical protein H4582DRAFT_1267528 [Lactarius indigo]